MNVGELAAILKGFVDAGYGESSVSILLNHISAYADDEIDIDIDNIDIIGVDMSPFIALEALISDTTLERILDRFGYENELHPKEPEI